MRARLLLAFGAFALPLVLVVAACSVDGTTPDCSQPDSKCEPAAPNANPDAHVDAKPDGIVPPVDSGTDAKDAADAGDAREGGDAMSDADAKPG